MSLYFHFLVIISPWIRVGPFIWTKLNPLHPRMLCAKFGWNWPSGSGEEDSFNSINVFLKFGNNLPLEKGGPLHLYKLELPLLKVALCHVWLKLARWFWRRRWKCEKFTTTTTTMTTTTTTTTDNKQILIRKPHLSLWLRWAKNHSSDNLWPLHILWKESFFLFLRLSLWFLHSLFDCLCSGGFSRSFEINTRGFLRSGTP